MYNVLPSFVLGFHGCDKQVAEKVFANSEPLKPSENDYDWLGSGVYFWENNPKRALDYATALRDNPAKARTPIKEPAVIGAIIDLGVCFNLLDARYIQLAKDGYRFLEEVFNDARAPIPKNKPIGPSGDLLLRPLDCAVVEMVHQIRQLNGEKEFDTIRGVFVEGAPIYPDAGINEFNHIQICVRNTRNIKGYFRPLEDPADVVVRGLS
jgi:hypothetical protein